MREVSKIRNMILMLLFTTVFLCACSNQAEELKLGHYVTEDGFSSWVVLEEDDHFMFSRSVWSSYLPLGTYRTEGNTLILHVTDGEEYLFSIEKDKLTFLENTIGDAIVEAGTEFYYDPDWEMR